MTKLPTRITVAALYRFVRLEDFADLRAPLLQRMQELAISGTILLAHEGINGTVAGNDEAIDALIEFLKTGLIWNDRLAALDVKKSYTSSLPFARCKVKLKNEIVTMGVTDIDPAKSAGTYVLPQNWNALISNPDVLIIDTRNEYEIKVGTFSGAVNPHITAFREFPGYAERELNPAKHRKIAMFCTGGIRCEKSTAYLKKQGFAEVYHLQGGILKYLEDVPQEASLWNGECFVFDERVAVDHGLVPGSYQQCHACRMPLNSEELESPLYVAGESCPHCGTLTTAEQRERYREREKQVQLATMRGEEHIGSAAGTISQQRRARKLQLKNSQRKPG
jgi:UPF0176 protein